MTKDTKPTNLSDNLPDIDQQLFEAVKLSKPDFTQVESLIQAGANVNARRKVGIFGTDEEFPLMVSLNYKSDEPDNAVKIWELLLKKGANPNLGKIDKRYGLNESPAEYAVFRGMSKCLNLLLEYKADVSPLHLKTSIERNHLSIVKTLVEYGVPLTFVRQDESCLAACCEAYRCRDKDAKPTPGLEIARYLLGREVDPNLYSPIANALSVGFLELAELLKEKGAKLKGLATPLAFSARDISTLEWLEKNGGDLFERSSNNSPAYYGSHFIYCVTNGEIELARYLIEKGADINEVMSPLKNSDQTPLLVAAGTCNWQMLEVVLPHIKLTRDDGKKLLSVAEDNRTKEIIAAYLGLKKHNAHKPEARSQKLNYKKIVSKSGLEQFKKIEMNLAKVEEKIKKEAPELISILKFHFEECETIETLKFVQADLLESFKELKNQKINSKSKTPLAAIVFEWAGHATVPYDGQSIAAGFAECKTNKKGAQLSKSLFVDCGGVNFSPLLDKVSEILDQKKYMDDIYSEINEYFHLKVASILNLALGQVIQNKKFAAVTKAKTLYFFVREHEQDPILSYIHKEKKSSHTK